MQHNSKIFHKLTYIISVQLHAFKKFKDSAEAVQSLGELLDGTVPADLKKFLKKNVISKEINEKLLCKIVLFTKQYIKAMTVKLPAQLKQHWALMQVTVPCILRFSEGLGHN
jgi:hypothetical protein